MKTKLIGFALFALTAAVISFYPSIYGNARATVGHTPSERQAAEIEVVFVLDTTGSMGGLIATAKEKIWSIANTMAQAQQAPRISMGLVAYRDRGDSYVTQIVDLSSDLDAVYARLMDLQADGGGDGPESVNLALQHAVDSLSWSQNPNSYKAIFLVGDAPPHMDYGNERRYPEILAAATRKGIVVNAIQCGQMPQTVAHWTEIARLGNGSYLQVEQAGGAVAIATPYDADLATLSAELDRTRLYYGSDDERAAMQGKLMSAEKLEADASLSSRARRAVFNASASGAANLFGERELLEDLAAGRVDLADIPQQELPATIAAVPPAEQAAVIEAQAAHRAELKQRIDALAEDRDEFLEREVSASGGAADSLDNRIYEMVRDQAAPKGLAYGDGPKF
jgi:Mg-chelatase subunit ChlD